jgi:hypothetical protein
MSLRAREAHRVNWILETLSFGKVGIVVSEQSTERTMPVTKVVVLVTLLEPYEPVNIAAVLTCFQFYGLGIVCPRVVFCFHNASSPWFLVVVPKITSRTHLPSRIKKGAKP